MENDTTIGYWKTNLLELQEKAPKPKMIRCQQQQGSEAQHQQQEELEFYGSEFHGLISRAEAEKMLFSTGDGAFLVRASRRSPSAYTLCIQFDGVALNYKLYFDRIDGKRLFYVGEKKFETVEMLVQDGLICMYVEKHASDYIKGMADEAIYEQSPYSQFSSEQNNLAGGAKRPIARCHNFSPFTFKMPHYCDFCRNFLWGLVQQGVRCSDCGFSAHKRCSEKTRHDCLPEAKYVKRMFAVDLTTLCLAHSVRVPPVLLHCIDEVERRGLETEGIYRVSGSHDRIEKLKRQYDVGQQVDLGQEEDIHTVAGLLKLYLRLLPQQLVPFSVFRSLLKAYTGSKETIDRIRNCRTALSELDEANKETFRALLVHLRKVTNNSAANKMSAENLATIFSPTIFCTGNFPALPNQQHVLLHFLIVRKNILGGP